MNLSVLIVLLREEKVRYATKLKDIGKQYDQDLTKIYEACMRVVYSVEEQDITCEAKRIAKRSTTDMARSLVDNARTNIDVQCANAYEEFKMRVHNVKRQYEDASI